MIKKQGHAWRVKRLLLDPCFLFTLFFIVWMLCFDQQDIFVQYRLYRRLEKLNSDQAYYIAEVQYLKKMDKALLDNGEEIERCAREKYYMKKPAEDLYVILPVAPE